MEPRRPHRRWFRLLLTAGVLLLLAAWIFNRFYLADLRPDGLRPFDTAAQALGEQRLQALADAHGRDAWEGYEVMEVDFKDAWHGTMAQSFFMPWTRSPQSLRARFLCGSWTSDFELLDGPDEGHRWGIQSWKTWKAAPNGEPAFEEDDELEFFLPTTQYFFELPFRIKSAEIVVDAGSASWEGKDYDRVFATWGSAEPQEELDQYLLWIDPDTGLLARVDYTVRDQGGAAVGSAHYNAYRRVGGVQMPSDISVLGVMPGGAEMPIHTFWIEDIRWNTVSPEALRPDPSLLPEGESKPGS